MRNYSDFRTLLLSTSEFSPLSSPICFSVSVPIPGLLSLDYGFCLVRIFYPLNIVVQLLSPYQRHSLEFIGLTSLSLGSYVGLGQLPLFRVLHTPSLRLSIRYLAWQISTVQQVQEKVLVLDENYILIRFSGCSNTHEAARFALCLTFPSFSDSPLKTWFLVSGLSFSL